MSVGRTPVPRVADAGPNTSKAAQGAALYLLSHHGVRHRLRMRPITFGATR